MSSISSIPASTPVSPPDSSVPKSPDMQTDSDADADLLAASQPPVLAALPPGQGTRIDQLC
jgi:hypothetical protein